MVRVIWDVEDDPQGNVQHILAHDVTQEEVEEVMDAYYDTTTVSRTSGNPITFGWTATGKYLAIVWEAVDEDVPSVYPLTAYPVPERDSKRGPQ
jgi:hypothetical protein